MLGISLLCLTLPLAACGSDKKEKSTTTSSPSSSATTRGCLQTREPPKQEAGGQKKPKKELDASKSWSLVVDTNCGSFTIALDVKTAPNTSASLVALAKSGFYNGTTFHRIVPGFVIQGGDPTGTGEGGPGYKTVDKPPADASYARGVVAMAKTQQEASGTAGSQFFVVTGQDAGLRPEYAIVGHVTAGLDVVEKIGQLGDPATERPTVPVVIKKVTVKQG